MLLFIAQPILERWMNQQLGLGAQCAADPHHFRERAGEHEEARRETARVQPEAFLELFFARRSPALIALFLRPRY